MLTIFSSETVANGDNRFRPREYETDEGPWDPVSGGASALVGTATQMMMGVADFPIETLKLLNIHPETDKKGKGKGKGKAKESGTTSSSASAQSGQPNDTQSFAASSTTSLPGVLTPDGSSGLNRPSFDLPEVVSPEAITETQRPSFMAQAMAESSEVSRSTSPGHRRLMSRDNSRADSRQDARSPSTRTFGEKFSDMNADSMVGTGKGIGRIVGAGFKSPLDFSLNIAKGFHNVPKLYGADVRPVDKVTDLQSGLRTAAKVMRSSLMEIL
jgi:hypothetical protein